MLANIDPEGVERRMIARLVDLERKNILEVGSGVGRETAFLVRSSNRIIGLDPDETKLVKARNDLPEVRFFTSDISNIRDLREQGLFKAYDLVVFSMALHHIPGRTCKLQSLLNAERLSQGKGGVLIIEPAMTGSVTKLICAFDQEEVTGIAEAQEILEKSALVFRERATATSRWVFPDQAALLQFFVGLLNSGRASPLFGQVTEAKVEAALADLGLRGATELTDDIQFYLL